MANFTGGPVGFLRPWTFSSLFWAWTVRCNPCAHSQFPQGCEPIPSTS